MWVLLIVCYEYCFFFFKQKSAYEMRISDWSSDVCSSDLLEQVHELRRIGVRLAPPALAIEAADGQRGHAAVERRLVLFDRVDEQRLIAQIGRASCRERVWQYV